MAEIVTDEHKCQRPPFASGIGEAWICPDCKAIWLFTDLGNDAGQMRGFRWVKQVVQ